MIFNNKVSSDNVLRPENRSFFDKYVKEIAKFKILTRDEEQNLFKEYEETGDEKILTKICKHNLLFVVTVARHYAKSLSFSNTIVLEDLVNEGNMGLCIAVKRFDYKTGNKFITYAIWFIRQQILNSMQFNSKNIRIPFSARENIVFYKNKKDELEQKLGCEIDLVDLYNHLSDEGLLSGFEDFTKMEHLLRMNKYETRLNSKVGDDEEAELIDFLNTSDDYLADSELMKKDRKNQVDSILKMLDEKTASYIRDYFGVDSTEPLNFRGIATKYNTNPTNVINHIKRGFRRINRLKNRKVISIDI
jgi:RNA polymerase primary sigma factor